MKKFTTIFFCMILSAALYAQIPNNDFENWAKPSGQPYSDPVGWHSTSDILFANGIDTIDVYKDSINFYHGLSSAKMVTKSIGIENVAGGIVSGNIALDFIANPPIVFSGGFPFTGQPGELVGYYEYAKPSTDAFSAGVVLTKWNGAKRDTIALGYLQDSTTETSFTPFSVGLVYTNLSEAPDTAFIAFFSSAALVGPVGSTLLIDDISFIGTAGINEVKATDVVSVFPNPAQSVIYINAVPGQFQTALIYDITGRLVETTSVIGNEVDVNDLATGNYIMMLNDRHNNLSKAIVAITR